MRNVWEEKKERQKKAEEKVLEDALKSAVNEMSQPADSVAVDGESLSSGAGMPSPAPQGYEECVFTAAVT